MPNNSVCNLIIITAIGSRDEPGIGRNIIGNDNTGSGDGVAAQHVFNVDGKGEQASRQYRVGGGAFGGFEQRADHDGCGLGGTARVAGGLDLHRVAEHDLVFVVHGFCRGDNIDLQDNVAGRLRRHAGQRPLEAVARGRVARAGELSAGDGWV